MTSEKKKETVQGCLSYLQIFSFCQRKLISIFVFFLRMKYSLRKSFSYRRRKESHDDEHVNPRIDQNTVSNSNLVKASQSKSFLRRRRRYSSSPPPSSPPD